MNVKKILVTGAGGFVGTRLVQNLLSQNYSVIAFDTYWFGNFLPKNNVNLNIVTGDLRTYPFEKLLLDVSHVIHLACISNDPSYEINETFSYEINYLAQKRFIHECAKSKVVRFIYASSSSVYGVKEEEFVTEALTPQPLTSYSKYKLEIENVLLTNLNNSLDLLILRPATLFGYSPRLRLDVVSNIFLSQAFFENNIIVHGGEQHRPQLSISDMISIYEKSILYKNNFSGQIYNVGMKNYTVNEISLAVNNLFGNSIKIEKQSITDNRSYRIDSKKWYLLNIHQPQITLEEGLGELLEFFKNNPDINWKSDAFHNVKKLKSLLK